MLSDKEIEAAYNQIRWRMDEVNHLYLQKVGEQIKKIGKLNPSSIDRLAQMRIYGANTEQIKQDLSQALEISVREVQQLLERAAREEYANADYMAVVRGRPLVPLEYNYPLRRYISALSRQTGTRMFNYSNTTNISGTYQEVVSQAIDAVSRGVTDYNSAIRDSMRNLGGDGLRVTYESGVTRRMDTAIRQNIIDGVRQAAQEAQRQLGEELGADGVELSAHLFSAPDHEPAQGRQFSLAEFEKMQNGEPFRGTDGKIYEAFRRPIGEWNCRHFASYIILGISPRRYTDEQLEQWKKQNHAGCVIDGKTYTTYEASQFMRRLETQVRKQKDIANLAKASGDDVLRREAQAQIRDLKAKYAEVAEAAGLRQRTDKMVVESYSATKKEKQELEKYDNIHYHKDGRIVVTDDWTTKKHPKIPPKYMPNAVIDTLSRNGTQHDRTIYGTDGMISQQIHGGNHGQPKQHPFGLHGEHIHEYKWHPGQDKPERIAREMSEEERIQHKDILEGGDRSDSGRI